MELSISKRNVLLMIVVGTMLAIFTVSLAQPSHEWEIQVGNAGNDCGIGHLELLPSGNYTFSYWEVDGSIGHREMAVVAPDGDILFSAAPPDSAYVSNYFKPVGPNEIIAVRYRVSPDSHSFCMFRHPAEIIWTSESVCGYISNVIPYIDNGFIATSYIDPAQFDQDIYLSRFDYSGRILWTNQINPDMDWSANHALGSSCTGNIAYPVLVRYNQIQLKIFTSDCDFIDETILQFGAFSWADNIIYQPDGNIIMSGYFRPNTDTTFVGIKTTPDGEILNRYLDVSPENSYTVQFLDLPDGGYIETASRLVYEPWWGYQVCLIRTDATGEPLWTYQCRPGYDSYDMIDHNTIIDAEGNVVVLVECTWYDGDDNSYTETYLEKFCLDPTDLEIAINPYSPDSRHPAPGRFFWHGTLTNNTDADIVTDVWVIVRGPDGYPSEPLRVWEDITVPANGIYEADLRQNIPADAASGEYNYIVRAGTYEPGDPQHTIQAYFPFAVTGGTEVNFDPPRVRGVVAAPFDGPIVTAQVE